MKDLRSAIMSGVAALMCLTVCGQVTSVGSPSDSPSGAPGQTSPASPVSDADTHQPSPRGTTLVGTIHNEAGEPVEQCVVTRVGETNELAIVSNAAGEFTMGIPFGDQEITISCDQDLYLAETFPVKVPEEERFTQNFVVSQK